MAEILRAVGTRVQVEHDGETSTTTLRVTSDAPPPTCHETPASFLVKGALLGRTGEAVPAARGDVIGSRPLEVHFRRFKALAPRWSA